MALLDAGARPVLAQRAVRARAPPARGALCVRALFTGIVQGKARVTQVEDRRGKLAWSGDDEIGFRSLAVEFPAGRTAGIQVGASVAVNGTCLTVTHIGAGDVLSFDVIEETLEKTNLRDLHVGAQCNFERSCRIGDEVGGHVVSGHVQTTAEVVEIKKTETNQR